MAAQSGPIQISSAYHNLLMNLSTVSLFYLSVHGQTLDFLLTNCVWYQQLTLLNYLSHLILVNFNLNNKHHRFGIPSNTVMVYGLSLQLYFPILTGLEPI